MAQTNATGTARNLTPQATGFSQIHSRGGAEGGGQAMSVLLSWHEKVSSMVARGAILLSDNSEIVWLSDGGHTD